MKAAIYNPYLDTLGGGERYTCAVVSYFVKKGFQVDWEWQDETIKTKFVERFGIDGSHINFVSDIKRGDGYDICFWVSDGSVPILRARRNLLHFQVPFQKVDGKSLLNKMKFFRIDKNICNSEFTKGFIDKEYGVKSVVLYPPIDTKKFNAKRKSNSIVYVGRFSTLTQAKRQDILVSAFKRFLNKVDTKWELYLMGGSDVGADEYLKELKKQSKNFPIHILENVPYSKLIQIVGEAKFFWSAAGYGIDEDTNPEKVEHFGISVVEAMASGCVPIILNKGGYKEIIEDGKEGRLWVKTDELLDYTLEISENFKLWKSLSDNAKLKAQRFSYDGFETQLSHILQK